MRLEGKQRQMAAMQRTARLKYQFVTDGERLAYALDTSLLTEIPWERLSIALLVTGRGNELAEFFQEITVVNLACRIVRAGSSLLKERDGRLARSTEDSTFVREYREFLRERLVVPHSKVDRLLRMAVRAVNASNESISETQRRHLKRHAQRVDRKCYMCGTDLDFDEEDEHRKFELEHVWPRSFGGNSDDDNLLPVCGACNRKKEDYATWGMVAAQSLILGLSPSDNERRTVSGVHRFALHYLAARRLLLRHPNRTLKWAFTRLGPWTDVRATDASDLGDFFNLENHNPIPQLLGG
jgi:5-methylcytosine-specific restriction endonuclease McrA